MARQAAARPACPTDLAKKKKEIQNDNQNENLGLNYCYIDSTTASPAIDASGNVLLGS